MSDPHYLLEIAAGHEGCEHCHAGTMYTIVSGEGEDQTEIGTSWGDLELAEEIRDLMNMAYEAGKEAREPFKVVVPAPGVQCAKNAFCFLRDGHEGDCDDLPF